MVSRTKANPYEVNNLYVAFLDSHGQDIREALARKVVVVTI